MLLMNKAGFPKIVNIMTPWAGVLVLGHGHIHVRHCETHHFIKIFLVQNEHTLYNSGIENSVTLNLFFKISPTFVLGI